jgi:hypothetical protein
MGALRQDGLVDETVGRNITLTLTFDRLTDRQSQCDSDSNNQWCVEAGSNTSTVTLRVVGGDKNGSLKTETVKYGRELQGTRTRE